MFITQNKGQKVKMEAVNHVRRCRQVALASDSVAPALDTSETTA